MESCLTRKCLSVAFNNGPPRPFRPNGADMANGWAIIENFAHMMMVDIHTAAYPRARIWQSRRDPASAPRSPAHIHARGRAMCWSDHPSVSIYGGVEVREHLASRKAAARIGRSGRPSSDGDSESGAGAEASPDVRYAARRRGGEGQTGRRMRG